MWKGRFLYKFNEAFSHQFPQVFGASSFRRQSRPLDHEQVHQPLQDFPAQRNVLHPTEALHEHQPRVLVPSQQPKPSGCGHDRNTSSWSVGQHQIRLLAPHQGHRCPYRSSGTQHRRSVTLPDLATPRNPDNAIIGAGGFLRDYFG